MRLRKTLSASILARAGLALTLGAAMLAAAPAHASACSARAMSSRSSVLLSRSIEPPTWDIYLLYLLRLLNDLYGNDDPLLPPEQPNKAMQVTMDYYMAHGFLPNLTQQQKDDGLNALYELETLLGGELPEYIDPEVAADLLAMLDAMKSDLGG